MTITLKQLKELIETNGLDYVISTIDPNNIEDLEMRHTFGAIDSLLEWAESYLESMINAVSEDPINPIIDDIPKED